MIGYFILESDGEAQGQVASSTQGPEAGRFVHSLRHTPGARDGAPVLEWQMATEDVFDWPWNSSLADLLSDRARTVIEPLVGPDDHVEWIPASVLTPEGVSMRYWVVHFVQPLDFYHEA